MSRVKFPVDEKKLFFFRAVCKRTLLPVGIDSGFISKRVPGIRFCTKHLSRFYRLGHPNVGPRNAGAGKLPAREWAQGWLVGARGASLRTTSTERCNQEPGCWVSGSCNSAMRNCDLEILSYPHRGLSRRILRGPVKGLVDETTSSQMRARLRGRTCTTGRKARRTISGARRISNQAAGNHG